MSEQDFLEAGFTWAQAQLLARAFAQQAQLHANLNSLEFAQAIAAERNVAISWSLTRQRHHQGTRCRSQHARPAAAASGGSTAFRL
jgi:hypothetical protein